MTEEREEAASGGEESGAETKATYIAGPGFPPSVVLPNVPAYAPPEPWGFWATLGLGLAVMLGILVAAVMGVVIAMLAQIIISHGNNTRTLLQENRPYYYCVGIVLGYAAGAGLTVLFAGLHRGLPLREYLGLRWPEWRTALWWAVGIVGGIYLYQAILLTLHIDVNSRRLTLLLHNCGSLPVLFVVLVVGVPMEELFLRGFLLPGLCRTRLGAVGGVALTAVLLASLSLHYGAWDTSQALLLVYCT